MRRLFALSFIIGPLVFVVVSVVFWSLIGLLFGWLWLGALFGLVLAVVLTAIGLWRADSIVRAVSRAEDTSVEDYPRLHNIVDGLCVSVGLPKPNICVVHDVAPNAMAFGVSSGESSLVFTTGLLSLLDRIELEAVVAQLLSRIRSGEVARGTRAAVLISAPVLARPVSWVMSVVSRSDSAVAPDIAADIAACHLTRYPPGLVRALEKLDKESTVSHAASKATAHLWFAEPLFGVGDTGRQGKLHNLFSARSLLEERIALLKEM